MPALQMCALVSQHDASLVAIQRRQQTPSDQDSAGTAWYRKGMRRVQGHHGQLTVSA